MTTIRQAGPSDESRPDIILPDLRTFYVTCYVKKDEVDKYQYMSASVVAEAVTAHSVAVEESGALSFVTLRCYNNSKDASAHVTRIFNKDQWIDVLDQAAPMNAVAISH